MPCYNKYIIQCAGVIMTVYQKENIDLWELEKEEKGSVYVVNEVTLDRGKPDKWILAASLINTPIDSSGAILTIGFHGGRGAWHLITEYKTAQKATDMQIGTLAEVCKRFAQAAGISKLPSIKVIEPGVGIYDATNKYTTENPWAMKDGETYEFTRRDGRNEQWIASVRNGVTKVTRANSDELSFENFDPALLFNADEWKSMRIAPEPSEIEIQQSIARKRSTGPR